MRYIKSFDGLRAFAVLGVMAQHLLPPEFYGGLPLGEYGVVMFFVLSGFLITRILLDSRESGLPFGDAIRAFYARRFLRIFPLYYAVLAVACLIGLSYVKDIIWWHLLYATNIYIAKQGDWLWYATHLWSLSVEEQFYLVWPFVALLAPKRLLGGIIVAMIVAAPLSRIVGAFHGLSFPANYVLPFQRLDALGLGALLAYALCYHPRGWVSRVSASLAALALGAAGFIAATVAMRNGLYPFPCMVAQASCVALFTCGLLSYCVQKDGNWTTRVFEIGPLVYLGKISYGLYIIHNFMPIVVPETLNRLGLTLGKWPLVGVELLATLAITSLSWHLFEKPIIGLKDLFPYARSRRSAEAY